MALRELLVDPGSFFAERDPAQTLPYAVGAVAVVTVATVASLFLVADIIAGTVEGPITVDNPEHPSWSACEGSTLESPEGCDEPAQIERSPESLMDEAATNLAGYAAVGVLLLWGVGTILFNLLARATGGSPSWSGTAALAGWAAIPELVRLVAGIGTVWFVAIGRRSSDIERQTDLLVEVLSSAAPVLFLVSCGIVVWQWHIVTEGLVYDADIEKDKAAIVAGLPLLFVPFLVFL